MVEVLEEPVQVPEEMVERWGIGMEVEFLVLPAPVALQVVQAVADQVADVGYLALLITVVAAVEIQELAVPDLMEPMA